MPSEGKLSPSLRDIYSSSYGHSKCLGKNKIKALATQTFKGVIDSIGIKIFCNVSNEAWFCSLGFCQVYSIHLRTIYIVPFSLS